MPKISVIMPVYNAQKTLKTAINSVISQSFGDFELIVIDDCSKDASLEILKELAKNDQRIVVLENEKNIGVAKTRNHGISKASGEWIAFLDSDDMWREDKLEKQLSLLERNEGAIISYTASAFMDNDGNPFDYVMEAEVKTNYNTLLKKNLLSCSSVMIKTEIMQKIEMPNDKMHEDYYVWLSVLKKTDYAYGLNEPLLIYRLSSNSKSSSRLKSALMTYNTYRAVGYCVVTAAIFTARYTIHSVKKRNSIKSSRN